MTYDEYGATGGYRFTGAGVPGQGPQSNISGGQAQTNPPPGGNPSNLPASIQQLTGVISSLLGAIQSQTAQTQQYNTNFLMMTGKTQQGGTHGIGGLGFSIPHSAGRGSVPKVVAAFPAPGGGVYTQEVENVRGQHGALPNVGTMSGLRARAARAISEAPTGFGPRLVSMKHPTTGAMMTGRLTGKLNADGTPEAVPVDAADVGRLQMWERVGSAAQGALGKAVTGEGLGGIRDIAGALLPDALAGPAGIAVAGVTAAGAVGLETAHMVASQRAQNAQFQSVMGGSNLQGMGQRVSQFGFGLRNAFTLGTGQAEEAYMGATQLGMRGHERNQALNMAVSSFNSMGMSVSQSLEAMSVQAQSGYENFNQLEQSLKDVTAAAKETSQNAETVRQAFISTLQGLTQSIGGGAGTNAAATAISTTNTNLGRTFAGTNIFQSMADNPNFLYMLASKQGISYNKALGQAISNPNYVSQGVNSLMDQFMNASGAGNVKGTLSNILKQGNYAPGPGGVLSPGQVQSVEPAVLNQLQTQIPAIQSMLQSITGQSYTPTQTAQFLIQWAQGGTQLPGAKSTGPQKVSTAQAQALTKTLGTSDQNIEDIGAAAKGTGLAGGTQIDVGTIAGTGGKNANLRLQYLKQVGQTKMNSPIVDAALKDNANFNKLYYVNTPQGRKTVNFNDLVTKYSDQLASGAATYATGSNENGSMVGTSVSGAYGGVTTAPQSNTPTNLIGGKLTTQAQKWQDKYQGEAQKTPKGAKGTNVTISATPQLQQLFGFAVNGQSITVQNATGLNPTLGPVNSDNLAGTLQQYGGQ